MRFPWILNLLLFGVLLVSGCAGNAEDAALDADAAAAAEAEAAAEPATTTAPRAAAPPAAPATTTVRAGTDVTVTLIDAISTGTNKAGDQFTATLAEPIVVEGRTIVAKGTRVQGRITDAESSGRVQGLASIRMVLTGIMDGSKTVPIVTRPFVAEAGTTRGRDAAVVGGAAGVGAAIGALAGGKKGAGIGALVGGASGTGAVLATRGEEIELGSESRIRFTLDQDVSLPMIDGVS